ncbi:hypothetical protein ACOME3_007484 [Neoechinorhynchus agilis]
MSIQIANSLVQGVVEYMKRDICMTIGRSGCCDIIATRYIIGAIEGNGFSMSIRIRLNGSDYYDIEANILFEQNSEFKAELVDVVASNVDPAAILSPPS